MIETEFVFPVVSPDLSYVCILDLFSLFDRLDFVYSQG